MNSASTTELLQLATAPSLILRGNLICNANFEIIDANDAVCAITGYNRDEIIGKNPRIFQSGVHDAMFYRRMRDDLNLFGFWVGKIWNRRKDGGIHQVWLSISSLTDRDGAVSQYIGTLANHHSAARSPGGYGNLSSLQDKLTGLENRESLMDHASRLLAKPGNSPMAVCHLDLTGLKAANVAYGYDGGNIIIVSIVARIKPLLKSGDTLARLGGGEFVILRENIQSQDELHRFARQILDAASAPIQICNNGPRTSIAANLGATLYPADATDFYGLLRHAERAMHSAKDAGPNCFVVFDPRQETAARSLRAHLGRITEGLRKKEFCLYYQPKVDMRNGRLIGLEGLARWQHPERGLLAPSHFIPAIENTAIEIAFGKWVLEEGIRQVATWASAGYKHYVSLNISASHLLHEDFCAHLQQLLDAHPLCRPEQIELEIVESAALSDIDTALYALATCRQIGVRIALDDFGTGYSSLAYFRRFPVDTIKIDRSFICNMQENPNDKAIVESVTALAQSFKRSVVAEGIETPEQSAMLVNMGCFIGQGFGISHPLPANELTRMYPELFAAEGLTPSPA